MEKKKIWIIVAIVIGLLVVMVAGILLYRNYKSVTVEAADKSFEMTIPGKVKFKKKQANTEDYKLDLYSVKDEMFFSSTAIPIQETIDLENTITKEKENLEKTIQNIQNLSDTSDITIRDYQARKYTYTYYDENYKKDIYTEVVWIKANHHIYVLDFGVITKNKNKYLPIFKTMQESFVEK